METERHYKGDDPEVEAGKAKAGERKPGLQLHVHIIVSRMDRSQTVSLSPLSKSRGNRQVLDGREVVVGFDRSQWSARCASRFNRLYGYFPYCRSKDEGLKEYSGEWKARNELRNETVSRIKREILHGEFREERRLYMNVCRLYRFVVNPRKAIIQELKGWDRSSDRKGKMRVGPFTHTGTAPVPPQESLRSSCPALPAQNRNHTAWAAWRFLSRHTSPALP